MIFVAIPLYNQIDKHEYFVGLQTRLTWFSGRYLDDLRPIMGIQLSRKERWPVAVNGVLW